MGAEEGALMYGCKHGKCGHNLGVDPVHNTGPKSSLMIKCISLPCLSRIHCLSSRSCLGAHQPAINGSAGLNVLNSATIRQP